MLQKIINWLCGLDSAEPVMLDHVPVGKRKLNAHEEPVEDFARNEKLAAAAKKHGRPFKCAATGLPREHYVTPGHIAEVDAPRAPVLTLPSSRARRG